MLESEDKKDVKADEKIVDEIKTLISDTDNISITNTNIKVTHSKSEDHAQDRIFQISDLSSIDRNVEDGKKKDEDPEYYYYYYYDVIDDKVINEEPDKNIYEPLPTPQ